MLSAELTYVICWTLEFQVPRDSVTLPDATVSGVLSGATVGVGLGDEGGVVA